MRWFCLALLMLVGAAAVAQTGSENLRTKQLAMLYAEAQYFSALAQEQKDELDKLKAAPCPGEAKP